LADRAVEDVSVHEVNTVFEGNLWALTPEAFRYFLPALMHACVASYGSVSVFAAELVGALTKPTREDVLSTLDRLGQLPPGISLGDPATAGILRQQQLEWFDSGAPTAVFHDRVDGLTAAEGLAVLSFLESLRDRYGTHFPFGELDAAIDRHWAGFRRPGTSELPTR
jgi:hypothetical protein